MKISLVQMDILKGKPEANTEKVREMTERASSEKPDIIVLPEMWNTGYSLANIREIADRQGTMTKEIIGGLARKHDVNIVAGSVSNLVGREVFNTMFIFDRKGKVVGEYSKIHLFRLMEEHKYLSAGNSICSFQLEGISCGGIICYDLRFPELVRLLALRGVKLLFIPAEWPHPRLDHWRTLIKARSVENQFFTIACNRTGNDGKSEFFGHSMVVDPWGDIIGELEEPVEDILTVELDLDLVERARRAMPVFGDRKPGVYECSFNADLLDDQNMDLDGGLELNIP
jgi:predicted amidohydrolase